MVDWWWWVLAVVVAAGAWHWYRENKKGDWRMTSDKGLTLALVAMAACFCWSNETGSQAAYLASLVASVAVFVLGVRVSRLRGRKRIDPRHRDANEA